MLCGAAAAVLLALMVPAPANAQLLPAGFFKNVPPGAGQAAVEAAMLAYDTATNEVSAEGDVILRYGDYTVTAERITYNQKTRDVFAEGNAAIRDPDGTIYRADRIKITDQMKRAFIESLTLTTVDGATVTADSTDYNEELQTILTNAEYSPCGLCIDKKGRRIGWKVRASKMIYDGDRAVVFLEGPQLELLGVPVAWMPWMAIPDPSQPRAQGFRVPAKRFGYILQVAKERYKDESLQLGDAGEKVKALMANYLIVGPLDFEATNKVFKRDTEIMLKVMKEIGIKAE